MLEVILPWFSTITLIFNDFACSPNLVRLSKDPNIKKIEIELMEKIGLKTQIKNKKNNKGTVTFDYRDLDQLDHLIEIIKKYY